LAPEYLHGYEISTLTPTVAPNPASTMERRAEVAEGHIPSNPIYDLENIINDGVNNLPEKKNVIMSGYNGADEDEIMDKVINSYSTPELDSSKNKTSQKVLTKAKAKRAAEVILEAAHKLN